MMAPQFEAAARSLEPHVRLGKLDTEAEQQIAAASARYPGLRDFIHDVLAQDPRPAFHQRQADAEREYGVHLYDFNVRWRMENDSAVVSAPPVASS